MGMVEVSIALAGIAMVFAAILPSMTGTLDIYIKPIVAIMAGIMATFSVYGSLWLLAIYCTEIETDSGFYEVWLLLRYSGKFKYYGLISWALAIGLVLSVMTIAITIILPQSSQ